MSASTFSVSIQPTKQKTRIVGTRFTIYQSCKQTLFCEVFTFVSDPPEVNVLRSWVNSGEGLEAKLDCVVHADPPAEVPIKVISNLELLHNCINVPFP